MQTINELIEKSKQLTPDWDEMLVRIRMVERHIILPLKALILPVIGFISTLKVWEINMDTSWDTTMHLVYLFFLLYLVISIAWGILIWGMNNLKQWQILTIVFVGIIADSLFTSAGMIGSKGFDSPLFWIFSLWIIRVAICLPTFILQLIADSLICLFYLISGFIEVWAMELDGLERDAFSEPVTIRIFFLVILSASSMGVHLALVRQQQILKDSQEFHLRQEQIRANGRLAGEIAHQLKNPLGIINNVVYTIQRKIDRGSTDINPQLQIIREEIERSDRIITDLMGYAKLAEGTLERLDINQEMNRAIDQVFPKGSHFDIKITRQYAQGLPHIMMQRNHLSEVLVNLLSNARDALGTQGEIAMRTRFGSDYVIVAEIADNGKGIPSEIISQIWTPYFTTKAKGTGLGMSIVKHNVEMYGGSINVYSESGKGTCFTIQLPARSFLKLK